MEKLRTATLISILFVARKSRLMCFDNCSRVIKKKEQKDVQFEVHSLINMKNRFLFFIWNKCIKQDDFDYL
jgi:hypothetical protein